MKVDTGKAYDRSQRPSDTRAARSVLNSHTPLWSLPALENQSHSFLLSQTFAFRLKLNTPFGVLKEESSDITITQMNLKTLSKMPNHKMGIVRLPLLKGSWLAPPETE